MSEPKLLVTQLLVIILTKITTNIDTTRRMRLLRSKCLLFHLPLADNIATASQASHCQEANKEASQEEEVFLVGKASHLLCSLVTHEIGNENKIPEAPIAFSLADLSTNFR